MEHGTREGRAMKEAMDAVPHLEIGSQLFHNGVPVRLLYRLGRDKSHEIWRVRPLFVDAPDRDERFSRSDCLSFLHTMRAPYWRRAA